MNTTTSTNRPADLGLGVALAVALAVTALAIADSWGGGYWVFGCATGAVVSVLALLRQHHRVWTAVAGLAVAATAIMVARLHDLPAEPSPATALGLSVLVGSSVRALPLPLAAAIATGGLAVVAGVWLTDGVTAVASLNGVGWLAAVATGLWLRAR